MTACAVQLPWADDGSPVWVAPEHVVAVYPVTKDRTVVVTISGNEFNVGLPVEEVLKRLGLQ